MNKPINTGVGWILALVAFVITIILIVSGKMELLYTGLLFLLIELAILL